ncbi:MAG: AAA family ATPase [Nanoarchaeota archaeon]
MGLFDDVLRSDQTLIKNESALDYEFLPKMLPYRENEQKYIAAAIAPLLAGRNARNLMIHGPPGIGKTAATKAVLRELEEKVDELDIVFLNCWKHNSTHKIALEICDQIGYKFTQNKRTPELYKIISGIVNKKGCVLVFDEIDKAEEYDFLYTLLEEVYKRSILLITNYRSFLLELDERIKSRLTPELLEFKSYSQKETEGILRDRLSYAFFDNVFTDDAFKIIADKTYEHKDIRVGIFLLREAALIAEGESKKKIEKAHAEAALTKLDDFATKKTGELDEEAQLILGVVRKHPGSKIGDLFREYEKAGGKASYKTFQRKIAILDEGRFVSLAKEKGAGGNTTIVNKSLSEY